MLFRSLQLCRRSFVLPKEMMKWQTLILKSKSRSEVNGSQLLPELPTRAARICFPSMTRSTKTTGKRKVWSTLKAICWMLSITFRFVRVIPAIPTRRTSDTEKTFLSYKVITSVTETKKNCIAVSNADRKSLLRV